MTYNIGAKTQVQQLKQHLKHLSRGTNNIDDYIRKA